MIFKLAWRNLWRNKRRTLITAASIFFAVLLAVFMRSFQEGSYNKMIENVVSFYTGYAQIHKDGYWDDQSLENSFEEVDSLKLKAIQHQQVSELVPRLESFALAASEEITEGCMVVGISPEPEAKLTGIDKKVIKSKLKGRLIKGNIGEGTVIKDSLMEGTIRGSDSTGVLYIYDPDLYLKEGEEAALVAEGLADKLKLQVGDTIILIGQGYHGISAAGKFAIKGLVKFGSPDLNKTLVYLPLQAAQQLYGAENRLTSYALLIDEPQQSSFVVQNLRQEFNTEAYEIMDWTEMMPELVQTIESDRAGGILTMMILYMIIGFGIFGTVLMMAAERKYEFGVLIAIGMKKLRLGMVLVVEIILIAILGVIGGWLASLPIVLYFNYNPLYMADMAEMYEQFGMEPVLPTAVDFSIFLNQAIWVLVITAIVSIYPLWKISRTEPVEAMRG